MDTTETHLLIVIIGSVGTPVSTQMIVEYTKNVLIIYFELSLSLSDSLHKI